MSEFLNLFLNKCRAVSFGQAPVSSTCQIPKLREHLVAAGLRNRSGVFVEIGAFDGESFSNTSFLADQGWRGVYVEPVEEYSKLAKRRHRFNNVTVIQKAVGPHRGMQELHVMGVLTTTSTDSVDAYRDISWASETWKNRQSRQVETITLADVFERAHVPTDFDLLVVDVEGAEEAIMSDLLASAFRPKVAIVELTDSHPDFVDMEGMGNSHARVRVMMSDHGYKTAFRDVINTIFVRY